MIYLSAKTKKKFFKQFTLVVAIIWFLSAMPFEVLSYYVDNETSKIEKPPVYVNQEKDVKNVPIKHEIESLREKNAKVFLKADGLYEKAFYNEDVHYMKEGKWTEIDNSLAYEEQGNEYYNKQNQFKIKLPKEMNDNKKIKLSYQNYQIDWVINGINQTSIDIEENIKKETQNIRELVNINQTVYYRNILSHVDLEYIIHGIGVKENIILNTYQENFTISMTYYVKGLTLTQDESLDYVFLDSNQNIVFKFNQFIMIDANGKSSQDIKVDVIETQKDTYLVTITPNSAFLKESTYPIKLDPSLILNSSSTIQDKTVSVGLGTSTSTTYSQVGYDYHTYMNFNIDNMIKNSTIIDATLDLYYTGNGECLIADCRFEINNVISTDYASIDYNTNIVTDGTPYEYDYFDPLQGSGYRHYNLTKLFQKWLYEGKDNGVIELKYNDDNYVSYSSFIAFYSMEYSFSFKRPVFTITYIDQVGLESYWTYHELTNGVGTGYVNDLSGNLTFVHPDVAGINHIYNSFNKDEDIGYGKGWRINIAEEAIYDEATGTYNIIDGDGTYRSFSEKLCIEIDNDINADSCAIAMDGSGDYYEYVTGSTTYLKLFNKGTVEYTYSKISDSDNHLYMTKIFDTSTDHYMNIDYQEINNHYVVNQVTDHIGNLIDFTYNSNTYVLENISYRPKNDDNSTNYIVSSVNFSYTNNQLTQSIHKYDFEYLGSSDDNTLASESFNTITYNNNHIVFENSLSNKIIYSFNQSNQVVNITEQKAYEIDNVDYIANVGTVDITYGYKKTTYTDYKGSKVQYTFDNYGRTINILDDLGNAVYYEYYAVDYNADVVAYNLVNKLINSSKPQNTTVNLIRNHSFEFYESFTDTNDWYSPYGYSAVSINNGGVYGIYDIQIYGINEVVQQVVLDKGQYSLSGFIKSSTNAYLTVSGINVNQIHVNDYISSGKYEKATTTFNVVEDNTTVTIKLVNQSTLNSSFDNIQLIEGSIDTRYNLIHNQSFEEGLERWTYGSGISVVDYPFTNEDMIDDVLGEKVVKINNPNGYQRVISQTLNTSLVGHGFVISGWVKANLHSQRSDYLQLYLEVTVEDEYQNQATLPYVVDFNKATNEWQYMTSHIDLNLINGLVITEITLSIKYQGIDDAYIDGLQLYLDNFGTSYTYNDLGNVTSKTDANNQKTSYYYTGNDVKTISPEGEKNTSITYNNRLIRSVTNNSKATFTYDENGNVTQTRVGDTKTTVTYEYELYCDDMTGECYMRRVPVYSYEYDYFDNRTTYSGFNQFQDVQKDEFNNTIDFDYETVTGLLKEASDAKGTTSYVYDKFGRLKSVSSGNESNIYTYSNGNLDTITVNGYSYHFIYDELNRIEEIKVNQQTLMSYDYLSYNEYISYNIGKQNYGNGDYMRFEYDNQDRISDIYFKGHNDLTESKRYHYEYDSSDLLTMINHVETGESYFYNYDSNGRLTSISDTLGRNVSYGYDELHGELNYFYSYVNNTSHSTFYNYSYSTGVYDNTQYKSNGNTITKQYNYDLHLLQRLLGFTVTYGSNNVFETEYYHDDDDVLLGTSTYRIGQIKLSKNNTLYRNIYYSYDSVGNIIEIQEKNSNNPSVLE